MKIFKKKIITVCIDAKSTGREAERVRKKYGYSFREVAKEIFCTASFVSDLEKGHRLWNGQKAKEYLVWLFKKDGAERAGRRG